MKKGKIITKNHIAVFAMVLVLAGAVWLNVRYSGGEKFLGQAAFVSKKTSSGDTVETAAKVKEKAGDYFAAAVKEREDAFAKAQETVEETLRSASVSEEEKQSALKTVNELSNRIATAQNIEAILKAKGFEKVVAILGDGTANIVVSSDPLTEQQTVQIQDTVTTETDIPLKGVKIITVK